MKVERETAGFALPFTAGVLLAAYTGYGIYSHHFTGSFIASVILLVCISALMHPERKSFKTRTVWILITGAAFMSGVLCALTAEHIAVSSIKSDLILLAEGLGSRMQDSIDRIPFSDNRCNAISKALITGERSSIPDNVSEAFRRSGASHILALSGLHLGIIYAVLTNLLSIAGNYRRIWAPRSFVTIIVCGLYTLATGAGPSIVRAFLFIFLAEAARLTHRHHSTAQLLLSALVIQLTLSPMSIKSVGFQLSYAAMAGIAFILPHLQTFWPGNIYKDRPFTKCVRKIWNAAAMSISCQLTTAPLAFHYFDTFPKHFLLTNLIALPLTGIIIPMILMTLALNCFGICPSFVISMTETLLSVLIGSLEIISTM